MTATQLGREIGRSAREMNALLKAHGFMDGPPGAYSPTELGQKFATVVDVDNGYGGYAHRAWGWLTWDPTVLNSLKSSMEKNPDGIAKSVTTAVADPVAATATATRSAAKRMTSGNSTGLSRYAMLTVAVIGGAVAAAPTAKRFWQDKVQPAASDLRARRAPHKATPATTASTSPTHPE